MRTRTQFCTARALSFGPSIPPYPFPISFLLVPLVVISALDVKVPGILVQAKCLARTARADNIDVGGIDPPAYFSTAACE